MNALLLFTTAIVAASGAPPTIERDGEVVYLPPSNAAKAVLGKRLPLDELVWLTTDDRKPVSTEGKVTLVRWWTETCPYCEASLPAIEQLREEFGDDGFQAVGVYHRKSAAQLNSAQIVAKARAFGFEGDVAVDVDWKTLKSFYLSKNYRSATSVSFLLDAEGKVRYVHPGPVFFPSNHPEDAEANTGYDDVKMAIRYLLFERGSESE